MRSKEKLGSEKFGSPKILLTGANGQVGHDLYPLLARLGDVFVPGRCELDLSRPNTVRDYLRAVKPNVIVNAAAYTAVDRAEREPELARAVNAVAPGIFAEEASATGALLIHYSTDYVFDGTKAGGYVECDPANPLNVYGRTKLEGEEAIRSSGCEHFIFRTSWVYSPRGSNFLLTMLRLARERSELRIVDDQVGAPTSSAAIAEATLAVLRSRLQNAEAAAAGTYHMTASGCVSWYGFARAILEQAANLYGSTVPKVVPIPASEYPTPARRPSNSVLDCSKLKQTFGITLPRWQESMQKVVHSIANPRLNHALSV